MAGGERMMGESGDVMMRIRRDHLLRAKRLCIEAHIVSAMKTGTIHSNSATKRRSECATHAVNVGSVGCL